ncbi:hypothetical protein [Desulfothermobacter acidiphilus]|uniref:hypothetical protein n=1 Tax=Desulfothermobacter acidiphilus TaxID=1938353 RepID=UPI003F888305
MLERLLRGCWRCLETVWGEAAGSWEGLRRAWGELPGPRAKVLAACVLLLAFPLVLLLSALLAPYLAVYYFLGAWEDEKGC